MKKLARHIMAAIKIKNMVPVYQDVSENQLLSGKIVLIVGGTGKIGQSIAISLLKCGCKVVITGSKADTVKKSLSTLEKNGDIQGVVWQLNDFKSYEKKIEESINIFGKIDIFIDAAGVHSNNINFFSMTQEEYDRVMDVDLKSMFFCSQLIAKYMIENGIKGHILLISSSRGNEPAWTPYGLAKWGTNGLVKGLAKLLTPKGIIVNGIAPGSTATPLVGYSEGETIYTTENTVERYVMPEEVGNIAKFLVSDMGNMIIGDIISISGGRGIFDIR